ncbi:MAG: bifunctional hydroxymethylpyrimidine kinase/phosphomethylpyrimidine kinase [Desulfobacteraceae bacterium]|nr:bifunctional hydroxymethylpyrimidine kinase/phosphomethylpyrimidine kinase [Desulfobacteraceae bacterium]
MAERTRPKGPHVGKPERQRYFRALTVAGSDSGGGAGIQADLKTFSALGCYGMSVITALTAQNTVGVTAIHAVPPDFVEAQMDAVLTDIGTDAVKIGMLFSADLIEAVAHRLKAHAVENIVLDPVMVAQSGDKLLRDDAVEALREILLPMADLATPNLPEAEILVNRPLQSPKEIEAAARRMAAGGCRAVLIKGGHGGDVRADDWLYLAEEDRMERFGADRVATRNNHGTGCTLSAAIAAHLAHKSSLFDAVKGAKEYITEAIRAGAAYGLGNGSGPVHHFHRFWQ